MLNASVIAGSSLSRIPERDELHHPPAWRLPFIPLIRLSSFKLLWNSAATSTPRGHRTRTNSSSVFTTVYEHLVAHISPSLYSVFRTTIAYDILSASIIIRKLLTADGLNTRPDLLPQWDSLIYTIVFTLYAVNYRVSLRSLSLAHDSIRCSFFHRSIAAPPCHVRPPQVRPPCYSTLYSTLYSLRKPASTDSQFCKQRPAEPREYQTR